MLLCLYSDSSPLNHDFATYLIHFACHCLTPVLRVFFGELRDCNIFRVSENTPPPPQSTSFKAPRAVDKVQKCQAEYNRNQTLSSLIHCLVCRLLFVMFTINHTCSSNTDLATLRLCFFEKDLSEVKELKGDNRVEENIWKTFKKKKKKMKAQPERDHRLQLQQCAAVMEAITRTLERTEKLGPLNLSSPRLPSPRA